MCGHAGLTVGAGAVGEHVRRAGCPVDQTKPASYDTGTNKTAKKGSNYPAVVQKPDALSLETRTFGVARLRGTHCVFDGWMAKPTWAKAAKSANGRCAIVVTSFVEGITCRRPDDKVFFILALAIGDDSFVILTTDAKQTSLLGERARKSEGFGSGRCPLYADGAQAARWCASASAEDPAAVAAEIEAQAQVNALGLVTGATKRGAATQSRTLQDFWGAAPKKKAKTEAPPRPPATAAPGRRTVAERDAKRAEARAKNLSLRTPAVAGPLAPRVRDPPSTSRAAGAPPLPGPRPRPQPANDPGHEDDYDSDPDERAAKKEPAEVIEVD